MKLIEKDASVAEIQKRRSKNSKNKLNIAAAFEDNYLLSFIDTLEVKEVDLEEVFNDEYSKFSNDTDAGDYAFPIDLADYRDFAKHFFELGVRVNNPITAADRGTAEEIIINLKRVEQDYRINLTREMEWLRNKVQKGD